MSQLLPCCYSRDIVTWSNMCIVTVCLYCSEEDAICKWFNFLFGYISWDELVKSIYMTKTFVHTNLFVKNVLSIRSKQVCSKLVQWNLKTNSLAISLRLMNGSQRNFPGRQHMCLNRKHVVQTSKYCNGVRLGGINVTFWPYPLTLNATVWTEMHVRDGKSIKKIKLLICAFSQNTAPGLVTKELIHAQSCTWCLTHSSASLTMPDRLVPFARFCFCFLLYIFLCLCYDNPEIKALYVCMYVCNVGGWLYFTECR